MDSRPRPILVVGDRVADRWDLAWALQEAGIPAEQADSGAQARDRVGHGRLAGVVIEGAADGLSLDDLVDALAPDPETGEIPFVLSVPRPADPKTVVARVRTILQASLSLPPQNSRG